MNELIATYKAVVFKKYAEFAGRAGRREFWMFVLANIIVGVVVGFFGRTLSSLYSLLVLIPSLAVGARRLHDTGRSGWWQLLYFIPFVGWIVLIVFFAERSHK